jgi:cytochrome c oxidase subunit 2
LLAAAAFVLTAAVAVFPHWLPNSASQQADRIDFVFWYVTWICVGIYAIVASVLAYAMLHFRAAPDDDSDGPPVHGHSGLEVAWTAIPFVLVTSMAIVCAIVLARNDHVGKNALYVDVTAQQFAWSFKYPDANNLATTELRLPIGRTARFTFRALDVIHSFWVPEFGQKQDTVPGILTHLTITPNRVGVFPIVCTELCGLGHSVMRSTVIVMTPGAFDTWLKSAGKAVGGGGANAGKAVFSAQGCGACHTLKAAGATGKIGPDLDKLQQYAAQFHQPLETFIRTQIVHPDTFHQPGFPTGVMPHTFASLPKSQLDALVQFIVASTKGAK